ncbi:MAG: LPS assembly lipoprotein LptE [Alphaproteobacteria bacterium]
MAGCGFEPLHGRGAPGQASTSGRLAQVQIPAIGDRVGQLVRNRLLDYFEPPAGNVPAVYRLDVDVTERKEGLAIQDDQTVTRYNLRLNAKYRLVRIRTGAVLLNGATNTISAYNVIRSDYANLIAERDARARAAQEIGDAVGLRVAVFLQPRDRKS